MTHICNQTAAVSNEADEEILHFSLCFQRLFYTSIKERTEYIHFFFKMFCTLILSSRIFEFHLSAVFIACQTNQWTTEIKLPRLTEKGILSFVRLDRLE